MKEELKGNYYIKFPKDVYELRIMTKMLLTYDLKIDGLKFSAGMIPKKYSTCLSIHKEYWSGAGKYMSDTGSTLYIVDGEIKITSNKKIQEMIKSNYPILEYSGNVNLKKTKDKYLYPLTFEEGKSYLIKGLSKNKKVKSECDIKKNYLDINFIYNNLTFKAELFKWSENYNNGEFKGEWCKQKYDYYNEYVGEDYILAYGYLVKDGVIYDTFKDKESYDFAKTIYEECDFYKDSKEFFGFNKNKTSEDLLIDFQRQLGTERLETDNKETESITDNIRMLERTINSIQRGIRNISLFENERKNETNDYNKLQKNIKDVTDKAIDKERENTRKEINESYNTLKQEVRDYEASKNVPMVKIVANERKNGTYMKNYGENVEKPWHDDEWFNID